MFLPKHLDVGLNGPPDDVNELCCGDDVPVEVDPERRRRVGHGNGRVGGRDGEGRVQVPHARVDGHAIVRSEKGQFLFRINRLGWVGLG
jgi:hypothetical protein